MPLPPAASMWYCALQQARCPQGQAVEGRPEGCLAPLLLPPVLASNATQPGSSEFAAQSDMHRHHIPLVSHMDIIAVALPALAAMRLPRYTLTSMHAQLRECSQAARFIQVPWLARRRRQGGAAGSGGGVCELGLHAADGAAGLERGCAHVRRLGRRDMRPERISHRPGP